MQTLLSGEYDNNNALVKIHSGAGGTEACDWTNMLYRMYQMFADKNGFKCSVLDKIDADGGIKSVTIKVVGDNAYGYLKSEMGVHRLVRISPFDSNKRRHTSFASVEVMPEISDDVVVDIRQEDLKIDVYRSGGAGGQHVNTTDSAVRITHIPTGVIVACQQERSQLKNREMAMSMLRSKLLSIELDKKMQESMALKGEAKKIEWGSQIRSYVFCPYTMVKDHRTSFETSDITSVMNGEISDFIFEFLKVIK
jgi:peptide chain release factor 2